MPRTVMCAALAAALVSSAGCSPIFMTYVPWVVAEPDQPLECTDSGTMPALDAGCAALFAVNTARAASKPDCTWVSPQQSCLENRAAYLLANAGLAAVCAAGAFTGWESARRCSVLKAQNRLCVGGDLQACKELNPYWRPATGPNPAPPPAPGGALPPGSPAYATFCSTRER